jgi:hypothetical protein
MVTIPLLGCSETKEDKKNKYNKAINQVILLENERIQEKGKQIKRKDIGISVDDNGKYIELIYTINSKHIDPIYKLDKQSNSYKYINLNKLSKDEKSKLDKDLEKTDYLENLGLK